MTSRRRAIRSFYRGWPRPALAAQANELAKAIGLTIALGIWAVLLTLLWGV